MTLGAGAGNESHHLLGSAGVHAHDAGDMLGSFRTAGNAAVGGSFAGSHSGSIAVTAGVAAAAAVGAGQAAANGFLLGVHFHVEYLRGEGQDGAEDAAQHAQDQNGQKDRSHISLTLLRRSSCR